MEINGYYREPELMALLGEDKITRLDFVMHRSEEETNEFFKFCKENDLQQDEYAAGLFLDHLAEEIDI